ncbi:MAG: hypothetical protein WC139_00470 [Candidatus Kapaibacterium sp.]
MSDKVKINSEPFVREAINKLYSYLNSHIIALTENEKKYSGFLLDISNPSKKNGIGIGSVAIGLSMYTYEKNNDKSKMEEMCNFIIDCQLSSGAWTVSTLREKEIGLTYTTCYALNALILYNYEDYKHQINDGLLWLSNNVNVNEGWGFKQEDKSEIYATAEVLRIISLAKEYRCSISYDFENNINKAKLWLIKQKENMYWKCNNNPSLYYTALCYKALVNDSSISLDLTDTRKWLISNINNAKCLERKQYQIDCKGFTYRDQIDCFTKATVLNAILSNKNLLYSHEIEIEIVKLLKSQDNLGYFTCHDESIKVPIFLNYYVIDTLDLYTSYLIRKCKPKFKEEIEDLYSKFPFYTILFLVLTIIGFIDLLLYFKDFLFSIPYLFNSILNFFEKQSGLANLVTISGVSTALILTFIYRMFLRNKKGK